MTLTHQTLFQIFWSHRKILSVLTLVAFIPLTIKDVLEEVQLKDIVMCVFSITY